MFKIHKNVILDIKSVIDNSDMVKSNTQKYVLQLGNNSFKFDKYNYIYTCRKEKDATLSRCVMSLIQSITTLLDKYLLVYPHR